VRKAKVEVTLFVTSDLATGDQFMASDKNQHQLKERTKQFALRVMRLVDALPARRSANVVGDQLLRSATSVGANYRSARRARSIAEFCSKLGIVEEEADESLYWLELIAEGGLVKTHRLTALIQEADEIVAMVVASLRTAKNRRKAR
jgi:four helix bundle protein